MVQPEHCIIRPQEAANSANALKNFNAFYYAALYERNLEMMHFIIEPFITQSMYLNPFLITNDELADLIIKLARKYMIVKKEYRANMYWCGYLALLNFFFAIFATLFLQPMAIELITLFILFSVFLFVAFKFKCMSFFRRQLKKDITLSFWMYVPTLAVVIFALFISHYLPSFGIEIVGIFIIIILVSVFCFNLKR